MKKILLLLSLLPTLVCAADPHVVFTILPTAALSVDSPNVNLNRTNIMFGLLGNAVPTNRNNLSAAWHIIPLGGFEFGDACVSTAASGFHLWRGQTSGAFPAEYGQRTLFVVRGRSANGITFRSADVQFLVKSFDPNLNLVGNVATNSTTAAEIRYSSTFWGLWYGSDRIKGTVDDQWYVNGQSSTTPVDEIFYIGVRSSYTTTSLTTLESSKAIMLSPNYYITCAYFLRNGTGSGSNSVTLGTAPWHDISRQGNGSITVHGQPGVFYTLQSTMALSNQPSATVWVNKPGMYTNGQVALGVINLGKQKEFFRLQYTPSSSFAPATAMYESFGGSSGNGD